ncbi:DUF5947 family protein [Streptomyces sp. NPDC018031]|uniref:DUF5947 family protein n=1 Tax=Streptomyces sp. NPDC018031 TaxID=3365033 RepID=UPI0037A14263
MTTAPLTTPGLRRRARAAPRPGAAPPAGSGAERCDLCAETLPASHRHLLEARTGTVRCACTACSLLFDHAAGDGTGYRLLPADRRRLDGCVVDDATWAALGVPVGLVFFTRSPAGVTAAYPGPLGLTRSVVEPHTWARLRTAHPALPRLRDDVEALLAQRDHPDGRAPRYWIVPLDDCYRLAALVRAHWKGLGGGGEVWQRIDDFLDTLAPG